MSFNFGIVIRKESDSSDSPIGVFFAFNLHTEKLFLHQSGNLESENLWMFEVFVLDHWMLDHWMLDHRTPVAGTVGNREDHRPILLSGYGSGGFRPRRPVHRMIDVLQQVVAGFDSVMMRHRFKLTVQQETGGERDDSGWDHRRIDSVAKVSVNDDRLLSVRQF